MAAQHFSEYSVPVPYRAHLQGQIHINQIFYMHGKIHENAKRFDVSFLNGVTSVDDAQNVVFHISVRFDEGKIIFNTMENGKWEKEEREKNPWKPGDNFDFRIRTLDEKFEILADHKTIHEFKYRVPIETTNYLEVKGDINLQGIRWDGRVFPVPYEAAFPNGRLHAGQRIYVTGIPKGGKRFDVNLIGRNGDILFHFNPRFDEKAVVRNSNINGSWGTEEREGPFPFKKDQAFDLVIINEPYSIQLYVDGKHLGTFAHRAGNPENDYAGIRVEGDIDLTGVDFSH